MSKPVTYSTMNITDWNTTRRGEITLDDVATAYLGDHEITDRDRIAFALRELRTRGYDVEANPVDWMKGLTICSLYDSALMAFGSPTPSSRYRRLAMMAWRTGTITDELTLENFLAELYDYDAMYDANVHDSLQEPYEFSFKGDAEFVEASFRRWGSRRRSALLCPTTTRRAIASSSWRRPTW